MRMSRRQVLQVVAGCVVLLVGMGLRNSFAMFLGPVTEHLHWTREQFSLGIAVQMLVWGLAQPFAGMIADRYGTGRVVLVGGLSYAAGVGLSAHATHPAAFGLSAGCLGGLGLGAAGFAVVLAAMTRAVPARRRTLVMGVGTAAGSAGQFLLVPISQALIDLRGWQGAYTLLALAAAVIVPAAYFLRGRPPATAARDADPGPSSPARALAQAAAHRPFLLLMAGYFVCGFQLAFITSHLPVHLTDGGRSPALGAVALSVVGLCNIVGCLSFGVLGDRRSKKTLLALIYLSRGVAITAFVLAPMSAVTVLAFAAAMGATWLSTVPLTTGLVGQMFGPRYLATLGGLVFCSHQLGSVLGVWLAGRVFDRTGSYELIWWSAAVLSFGSALVHARLDDRPLHPLRLQTSPEPVVPTGRVPSQPTAAASPAVLRNRRHA